jgi:hypothetical protein
MITHAVASAVEVVEWGVMELNPATPHGNTLPQNQRHAGDVWPMASQEQAEDMVLARASVRPREPLAVVRRVITTGPWEPNE